MINLRLRSLISTSHREDRGAALAIVAMLGSALMLTASVVVARGVAQFGNTAGSGCWEQALATAESALNWGLGEPKSISRSPPARCLRRASSDPPPSGIGRLPPPTRSP